MYYLRFWRRWFSYMNYDVVQSFEYCVQTVQVRLQFGRKSFPSNWITQPHFSTFLEHMICCFDVVPRLHPLCRYVNLFSSNIVNVFKTYLEISKVLFWRWRRIRRTTEQKILGKMKFTTTQHLWWSITGSHMDSTAVCKQEQQKLQIPVLLISGCQRWKII